MEIQFPHEYLNKLIGDRLSTHATAKNHADMRRSIAVKLGIASRTLERYLTGQTDMASRTMLGLIDALEMTPQEINRFMQFYRQSKNKKVPIRKKTIQRPTTPRNK